MLRVHGIEGCESDPDAGSPGQQHGILYAVGQEKGEDISLPQPDRLEVQPEIPSLPVRLGVCQLPAVNSIDLWANIIMKRKRSKA